MKGSYKRTIYSCFIGYVVQAVVVNFLPLLFVTLEKDYGITVSQISLLITVNFVIQLSVDLLSAAVIDRIGYRVAMNIAHILAATGLVLLAFLPDIMDPFVGILIPVAVYAMGGGLLEVIISPMVEACPTENKEKAMSLLHSFYSWGQVGVVLLSTAFFAVFGVKNWRILALIWAAVPVGNILFFASAPVYALSEQSGGEEGKVLNSGRKIGVKALFSNGIFWIMMIMMICAGAAEQAVNQWASAFAEQGLGVSKTVGDLAGPMSFAVCMGLSRLYYGKKGDRIDFDKFMIMSCAMCVVSYGLISLAPLPAISLIGCGLCGFSVGILWPGTYSKAASAIKGAGTAMFALLALGGDFGCSAGPALAGYVSGLFGGSMKAGIAAAAVFPAVMLAAMLLLKKAQSKKQQKTAARCR